MTPQEYYAERHEAEKRLNPETVISVFVRHGHVVDPYGVYGDLSPEEKCVGLQYFASSPDEGVISFYDLPDQTLRRLEERGKSGAFDAEELDLPF